MSGTPRDAAGHPAPRLVVPGDFGAVVFDFDGLLVDSEPGWEWAERTLLGRHGHVQTAEDRAATLGRSAEVSAAIHARILGLPEAEGARLRDELLALGREAYLAGFQLRPGAAALVGALRGRLPIAVASNTPRGLVDLALARTPFADAFTAIATRDEVAEGKPAPDVYLLACEKLGVEPARAIAFEDSLPGVTAALAAGMTVAAVPAVRDERFGIAHHLLDSLGDVAIAAPSEG
jgi:beta-phosphoglucomutase-like phosphatase (HAD superfamily)